MTTIFTPPAGCANSWTYEAEVYNSVSGGLLIQNLEPTDLDTSCFPESFGGYGRAPSSIQVFSPGACPNGYQTPGQFQAAGTTTAICCPSYVPPLRHNHTIPKLTFPLQRLLLRQHLLDNKLLLRLLRALHGLHLRIQRHNHRLKPGQLQPR
jgi:hypothetical protein